MGEPIMPLQMGVNYYYAVSSWLHTTITERIHHSPAFYYCYFFFASLRHLRSEGLPFRRGGRQRRSKRVKRSVEEEESMKRKVKRGKGCVYLDRYIKRIISVIATKGQDLEFHSLPCTTGAVTVLTLCLSAVMTPAARHCGSRGKAESTL